MIVSVLNLKDRLGAEVTGTQHAVEVDTPANLWADMFCVIHTTKTKGNMPCNMSCN